MVEDDLAELVATAAYREPRQARQAVAGAYEVAAQRVGMEDGRHRTLGTCIDRN